jgi:hypothetical protein
MKSLIGYTICLLSLAVLFGCSGMKNNTVFIEDAGINEIHNEDITLIKSFSELEKYFHEERFANVSDKFKDQINLYSEKYFQSNYLIILNIDETSSSNKLKIKNIQQINNAVDITIKRKQPKIGDTAMKQWSFFIEFKKDETIDNVMYQIIE